MFFNKIQTLKNENEELKKNIQEYVEYKVNIENLLQNIGKDFSKISLILENRDKNRLKEDLKMLEDLFVNFNELFKLSEFPNHTEKVEKANLIEKASYQILRNYIDRDNKFIKEVIVDTKIR